MTPTAKDASCLSGGGTMGQLMREHDWQSTAIGPVQHWPQSLRTSVSILLESKFPMYVAWGEQYAQFYNDGYIPILGATKHPQALGISARETFPEIWHIIGPMFEDVRRGMAFGYEDYLLCLDRNGYLEECYFTFSYSPVRDETSQVGGIMVTTAETTARVIGGRRLAMIGELAGLASHAKSENEIWTGSASILRQNPADLPFCLLYRSSGDQSFAIEARCGVADDCAAALPVLSTEKSIWPLSQVISNRQAFLVEDVLQRFGPITGPKWPEPVQTALVLPVGKPGSDTLYGVLITGISTRRALDDQYRSFLSLVADHIATGISNVRAYEEERRRVKALAQLDRAKTEFFSNVSHEFRTPLTLMLGPLEDLISAGEKAGGKDVSALRVIYRNGLRLLRLVNSLLDFSRIEAGRIRASYIPSNLTQMTSEIASSFSSLMARGGLEFRVECMPLSRPVWVDPEMWEKVVLNLLSNAFKFTLSGAVTVRLRETLDHAELIVSDTGTGIPEHELSHLFERFHRVQGARGRTFEGTGIGLALVQELVRLHGGTINVQSTFGSGSTFVVKIPFDNRHLPSESLNATDRAASTAVRASAFVQEALQWLPDGSDVSQEIQPWEQFDEAPSTAGAALLDETRGARVLVVDDNADMRNYIRRLLSRAAYEVKLASDGEEALRSVREGRPDLVLSDVMMPGLDGFALLKALRSDPATQSLPVILLSARADEEARTEGLDFGADDYLTKPFTARELLSRAGAHVKLARVRRKAEEQARVILESITDGFFALDRDWRFTYVNAEGERLIGFRRDQMMGKTIWAAYPEAVGTPFYREYNRAMNERVPVEFESFYPPLNTWFRVKAYPADTGGLSVFYEDITERKQAEEQLRRANEDLEQFAYSASHDLQEPLRNVAVYSQLLERKYQSKLDKQGEQFLANIIGGAKRMSYLLSDLLAYSRVGSCADETVERTNSGLVLDQVLTDLANQIAESDAAILRDTLPFVVVRPSHLRQLFQNLIGNAIKYRKESEKLSVHVRAQRDGAMWLFSVADNGIGIRPEFRDQVFGLFKRLHGNTGKYSGTGIGLAICQRIVAQYGGRIWADSEEGVGSVFNFTLPGCITVE